MRKETEAAVLHAVETIIQEVKAMDAPYTDEADALALKLWQEKMNLEEEADEISIPDLLRAEAELTGRSIEQLCQNWLDLMRTNKGDAHATLRDFLAACQIDV